MKKVRVLLADDHSLMLAGLQRLLESEAAGECRCEVVGTIEDGRALVDAAQRLRPDIILLDISMPLLNGLDAAHQIRKLVPESKLIFVTMHASPSYATEAFKAGASGYLLKRSAAAELTQAIQAVLKGQHYITPLITKDVLESILQPPERPRLRPTLASLTPRQREVLQLVAEGKGTKDIARLLSISIKTVEFHKARIMDLLDLHSTAELIKYAIAEGLVSP
ncbi:response regulator [Candidatus Nitrospira bockiana]